MMIYPSELFGIKMAYTLGCWLHFLAILLLITIIGGTVGSHISKEDEIKTSVFLSPKIVLEPGLVSNKDYYDIGFPRGHIALKSLNAELVDEAGNSVPLHETYIHHWILLRYHQRVGANKSDHVIVRNNGVCDHGLSQYFGRGSETRRTSTHVPNPYGIEVGNPDEIPHGFEEKWMLNLHVIDTRGAWDRLGCTECRCDLYNVTVDEDGRVLPSDYDGGLSCCYDEMKCRVKERFQLGMKRNLYLKYKVKYIDWDASILPVKIYILDVTDVWTRLKESRSVAYRHNCLIEYEVPSCDDNAANEGCIHTKSLRVSLPSSGDVIYGVAHQHAGGIGSTLYGEDGRVICSSSPIYGKGTKAGNEAGYVVGMTTCYPTPSSVKIFPGEMLTLVSNYSNKQRHTGVMGLFYILVAESSDTTNYTMLRSNPHVHDEMRIYIPALAAIIVLLGVTILSFTFGTRSKKGEGYEAIGI